MEVYGALEDEGLLGALKILRTKQI